MWNVPVPGVAARAVPAGRSREERSPSLPRWRQRSWSAAFRESGDCLCPTRSATLRHDGQVE